jgi:hypothetical protein
MPFVRGRYHINPVMGEALEAAREAECALLALEERAQQQRQQAGDDDDLLSDSRDSASPGGNGPIHRVEIEAAEVVPAHSGRAVHGFVARVHRTPASDSESGSSENTSSRMSPSPDGAGRFAPRSASGASARTGKPAPETHVFADHRDLVDYLRQELARDCEK